MNKEKFLLDLASALAGLPEEDVERTLEYYSEMIDDRVEDGLSEEEAVAAVGTVDEIRTQIIKDTPLSKIVKERVKPRRSLSGLEITLLIVGFPIWFSLLVAGAATLFSVWVSLWAIVVSFYATLATFFGAAVGGLVVSPVIIASGSSLSGLFLLGCSLASAGIGILWIFVCKYSTRGLVWLTGAFVKSLFLKKGGR